MIGRQPSLLHEIFDVAIRKRVAQVLTHSHQDYQRLNFRHLNSTGRGFVISTTYQHGHHQSCSTTPQAGNRYSFNLR